MKRVMLARQPMYLLMPHDYCWYSIASSLPIGMEELLKEFKDVFPKYTPFDLLPFLNTSAMMNRDGLSKANFVKSLHEKGKAHIEKRLNNMLDIPIRGERKWLSNRVIGFGFT